MVTSRESNSSLVDRQQEDAETNSIHWTTLSDTIVVSPAGLPILKVVCNGSDTTNHKPICNELRSVKAITISRSKSVPNMYDQKIGHYSGEALQMKNRIIMITTNKILFQQLKLRHRWTLALICIVNFLCFCAISVLSPFFHQIAVLHNISTSTYGLIFSIHPAVVFCTSPFIGHLTPTIGPKFMFVSGVFLCGTCSILFGILEHVEDDKQFTILCILVRGLGAVGASAFSTAGATYVANLFPDNISAIMGILETFIGLGFSVGPLIGGLLFTLGGFQLPFYVMGSVMLLTLPFSWHLLPESNLASAKKNFLAQVMVIFKIPAVFIICLVVAASSSAWSVLEPTLVIHMQQFQLAPVQLGLLFLITSVSYAISSPIWGWVVNKCDHGNLMMIGGLSVSAFGLLLLGPSPVFPIPNSVWLNAVSLVIIGVFVALAYVPTYQALLQHAINVGCGSELNTYSIIAGLWASMYSLGEVLGPCVGSILVDVYDFPVAMTVMACFNMAVALLLLLFVAFTAFRARTSDVTFPSLISSLRGNVVAIPSFDRNESEKLIFGKEEQQSYGTNGR